LLEIRIAQGFNTDSTGGKNASPVDNLDAWKDSQGNGRVDGKKKNMKSIVRLMDVEMWEDGNQTLTGQNRTLWYNSRNCRGYRYC